MVFGSSGIETVSLCGTDISLGSQGIQQQLTVFSQTCQDPNIRGKVLGSNSNHSSLILSDYKAEGREPQSPKYSCFKLPRFPSPSFSRFPAVVL